VEDLPALRTGIYQLKKAMSGFGFVQHCVYSVFQRIGKATGSLSCSFSSALVVETVQTRR